MGAVVDLGAGTQDASGAGAWGSRARRLQRMGVFSRGAELGRASGRVGTCKRMGGQGNKKPAGYRR